MVGVQKHEREMNLEIGLGNCHGAMGLDFMNYSGIGILVGIGESEVLSLTPTV